MRRTPGFHLLPKDNRKLPVVAFNVVAPVSKSFLYMPHELFVF